MPPAAHPNPYVAAPVDDCRLVAGGAATFSALAHGSPLLLCAVPYRRLPPGAAVVWVGADGQPTPPGAWLAACARVDAGSTQPLRWTALANASGWIVSGDLGNLGLSRAHCDGAVLLLVAERSGGDILEGGRLLRRIELQLAGRIGAPAAGAPPDLAGQPPPVPRGPTDDQLRRAVEAVAPPAREAAAVPWQ
ncbi:MAG TPA: hypothetical protein PLB26_07265 [Rubrivivax sp.]|nr:hypothetical protein [Rubrivivax sp.]